jgi:hypothetical protein
VVFDVKGLTETFSVWSIQTTDENEKYNLLPYNQEKCELVSSNYFGDKIEGD